MVGVPLNQHYAETKLGYRDISRRGVSRIGLREEQQPLLTSKEQAMSRKRLLRKLSDTLVLSSGETRLPSWGCRNEAALRR